MTDSDSAGFKIRSFIGGSVPKDSVIHAYIPDVFGKERRKDAPSKEGKLGVEGIDTEILLEALNRAGVTCEYAGKEPSCNRCRPLRSRAQRKSGFGGSAQKFLRSLSLPERLSTSALVDMINIFMTYDEFQESIRKFSLSGDDNQ